MDLLTAVLGGFVGALIGLLIALLGQSREDDRLRRAEEWRQRAAKRERLREEFEAALLLVYSISVDTGIFRWIPPSQEAKTPAGLKWRQEMTALYEKAKAADIRLRLEGATPAWQPMAEVVKQHIRFRDALSLLDDPQQSAETRAAAREELLAAHKAIEAVAADLHEKLAVYLESHTPPGPPPPPSGLQSSLRQAEAWLRR